MAPSLSGMEYGSLPCSYGVVQPQTLGRAALDLNSSCTPDQLCDLWQVIYLRLGFLISEAGTAEHTSCSCSYCEMNEEIGIKLVGQCLAHSMYSINGSHWYQINSTNFPESLLHTLYNPVHIPCTTLCGIQEKFSQESISSLESLCPKRDRGEVHRRKSLQFYRGWTTYQPRAWIEGPFSVW